MNIDIQVLAGVECCLRICPGDDAKEKKIEELCARLTELLAHIPLRLDGSHRAVSRNTIGTFFLNGGCVVVALDKDLRVVGMGRLVLERGSADDTTAKVEDIVVDEHMRRRGIGRRILHCIIELALSHQVKHVDAMINPGDVVTNALLDEFGFGDDVKSDESLRRLILNT